MASINWEQSLHAFFRAGFHDPYCLGEVPHNLLKDDDAPRELSSTYFDDSESCALPVQQYLETFGVVGAIPKSVGCSDIQSLGRIISIRGSPARSLLHLLGTFLHIEPALLLDHLILPYSFIPQTLPSHIKPSVTVSLISIGCYPDSQSFQERAEGKQKAVDNKTEQYNSRLLNRDGHGAEQCRTINLHGPKFFSVEQKVTFLPYLLGENSWSGLVFNDSGAPGKASPWVPDIRGSSPPRFFPMTRLAPGALFDLRFPADGPNPTSTVQYPDPCQSRADLNDFMTDEDKALGKEDPFVCVLDLLATSSLCWIRFFSFLREVHSTLEGDEKYRADVFRHDKGVLDRSQTYFRRMIEVIDGRHRFGWPKCSEISNQHKVDRMVQDMRHDILALQFEARALSHLCIEKMNLEMVTISIVDSKRGLEQAARIQLLTFLAYFFIPSAFISSVFGMNVLEFTRPNPPLSSFFATVIPFTAFFLIIPLWYEFQKGVKACIITWAKQCYSNYLD